ncbi:hypothetical protein IPJ72_06035 [Candidatus Peregrinibacteria bacterium]|nr:MAG: hypothetical protein IPJ72_06035 [Candidatus Peregrinibacteria bacterium]
MKWRPKRWWLAVLFIVGLSLSTPGVSHALQPQSDERIGIFPFPVPYGKVIFTRGLLKNEANQPLHNGYDIQVSGQGWSSSCSNYGVPILAIDGGKVLTANQTGYNGGAERFSSPRPRAKRKSCTCI